MVGVRLKMTQKCNHCGVTFRPWYREQESCSAKCRNLHRNDRKKTAVVLIEQTCKNCGATFSRPYYARHCGKFCQQSAANKKRESLPDNYEPKLTCETLYDATDAPPGSSEKIAVMRKRMESGFPLWHSMDRIDFAGLTGS